MSLFVEIIKKRKNTTAPWEVRAIQSVIKQNFLGACPKNCVNGYVRISRLEPVCQIVWQIDICCKKFSLEVKL